MSDFFSALLKAPRYLPLLALIVFMLPAWLSWIFLSEKQQESALKMVGELRRWAVGDGGPSEVQSLPRSNDPNGADSDIETLPR